MEIKVICRQRPADNDVGNIVLTPASFDTEGDTAGPSDPRAVIVLTGPDLLALLEKGKAYVVTIEPVKA